MARFTVPPSIANAFARIRRSSSSTWKKYRSLKGWLQLVIAVVLIVVLLALGSFLAGLGGSAPSDTPLPTVTLATVGSLSGTNSSVNILGSVRSITEAAILAQSSGVVTSVRAHVGSSVPAGFIIASLDNASQAAAVLQAEGAYDGAIAVRSGASPSDISTSARNTYRTAYSSLDTLLKTDVDAFFGPPGPLGPQFTIGPSPFDLNYFPPKRQAVTNAMATWRNHLASADTTDPGVLLTEAETDTHLVSSLLTDISVAATKNGTDANASQLAALATARAGVDGLASSITSAKVAYQGQGTSATLGVNASVKSALGSLRAAQANLEKTLVRSPISGTLNFMPLHVGDYVTALSHAATVAQNGALEIVTYVSEDDSSLLSVGTTVQVENQYPGIVTQIAPALDPTTKQIEVHVAVNGTNALVNGQAVHIALPQATKAPTLATSTGPLLLPLTAVKLTPSARAVFSVGEDGKLVAHTVEIGDVRGDRIEVRTVLPGDLRIVTDARGLSEGEKVSVAQ